VADPAFAEHLAQIVIRGVSAGREVEIDGLGTFYPDPRGFRFEPPPPRIFLAYGREDLETVSQLYDHLQACGFGPWMDVRRLLPGQNWPRAIENAIEGADFFMPCFSARSVGKKGGFQAELRYALDCARRIPLDNIYLVPVRLDDCKVPGVIQREFQYVDLFPDWSRGLFRLTTALRREMERRRPIAG
jgi:TIR domain-containing protein